MVRERGSWKVCPKCGGGPVRIMKNRTPTIKDDLDPCLMSRRLMKCEECQAQWECVEKVVCMLTESPEDI